LRILTKVLDAVRRDPWGVSRKVLLWAGLLILGLLLILPSHAIDDFLQLLARIVEFIISNDQILWILTILVVISLYFSLQLRTQLNKKTEAIAAQIARSDLAKAMETVLNDASNTMAAIQKSAIPAPVMEAKMEALLRLEMKLHRLCLQIDAETRVDPRATISLSHEVRNTLNELRGSVNTMIEATRATDMNLATLGNNLRKSALRFDTIETVRQRLRQLPEMEDHFTEIAPTPATPPADGLADREPATTGNRRKRGEEFRRSRLRERLDTLSRSRNRPIRARSRQP